MHDYAFVGNDETSLLFLKSVIQERRPKYIITGEDRFEGRGRKLTPSLLKSFADSNSIECFKTDDPNSANFVGKIKELPPVDYFLVFSFGFYLRKDFLSLPKRMCVNIHPSFLPAYRGAAPLNRAVMNGEKESGVTFFKMTSKMDAGPIIASKKIALKEDETSLSLRDCSIKAATEIFLEFNWKEHFEMTKQNDSLATFAPKIEKNEFLLDPFLDSLSMKNRINGLSEHGIRCYINEKKIKIRKASLNEKDSSKEFGVIEIKDRCIIMYCRKGSIMIRMLQPEGKSVIGAESFINGYKIKNGDRVCAEFSE